MTITSTHVVQLEDLLELCKRWDESPDEFARIVDSCLGVFGMSQREMANEFEVAESTVSRWANGVARPHPRLSKLIVGFIQKRARRIARDTREAAPVAASS